MNVSGNFAGDPIGELYTTYQNIQTCNEPSLIFKGIIVHYYQFNISDYKSHTEHLEPMEDLAYRRLLDWCYLHEKPLPKSKDEIARLIRMRTHCEPIANVLREFFTKTKTGEFIHKRVFLEIDKANAKSSKARESAKARWDNVSSDANALRTDSDSNATQDTLPKTQDTLPKKKKAAVFVLPEWIDQDTWKSFVEHRQKLKAPMTDHAKILMINKLNKLNGNPNEILNQSIESGWKGIFELKEGNNNGAHQQTNKPSLAERVTENRKRAEQQIDEQSMGENGSYIRS